MNRDKFKISIDTSLFDSILKTLEDNGNSELIMLLNAAKETSLKQLHDKKKIVALNREMLVFKTQNKIRKAVSELIEEGKKINANSVSNKSGVAIATINKYKELII